MQRPRHVAVAIDFSNHSIEAARLAFALARGWEADLTLIHAYESLGSHYPGSLALLPASITERVEVSAREQIIDRLDGIRADLQRDVASSDCPSVSSVVALGKPADAIRKAALKAAADLLVIGSRGKSQVSSWLLGSVVRDLAGSVHCPVLVTRGKHRDEWLGGFSRIVVGVDHTSLTRSLVIASKALLEDSGQVALITVSNLPSSTDGAFAEPEFSASVRSHNEEVIEWETEQLKTLRSATGLSENDAEVGVELGKPAERLLARAKSSKADLIALGSHARASLFDRVLGTTAERVLRHSEIPVLMFPMSALPEARTRVQGNMADFLELNGKDCKSYLIVSTSDEAMIVDPLLENIDDVAERVSSGHLNLKYVVDTHVHADHISGGPRLAEMTGATYVVHKNSGSSCAGLRVDKGDVLSLGKLEAQVIYTPGHASDAISLLFPDRLLTGDFLFIGNAGAGRTDLPGGDAGEHWDALRQLRNLEPDTLIFPGHDYHGRSFSTLAEERVNNPRLRPRPRSDYAAWLEAMDLGAADWMIDVVQANYSCKQTMADIKEHASSTCEVGGTASEPLAAAIDHVSPAELAELLNESDVVIIDVRDTEELAGPLGRIAAARHIPLGALPDQLESLAPHRGDTIITVCRSGARSDAAAARLTAAGFDDVFSLRGGMSAWRELVG